MPQNSFHQAKGILIPSYGSWCLRVCLLSFLLPCNTGRGTTRLRVLSSKVWSEAVRKKRKIRMRAALNQSQQSNHGTYAVNNRDDNFAHLSALTPFKQFCNILCPYY